MRPLESVQGDEQAEGSSRPNPGTLVVLSGLGPIAKATNWIKASVEGQRLIAVPALRVEHQAALMISGGMGLGLVFNECRLVAHEWAEPAGFVGGSWVLWRLGKSELHGAGFVLGATKFDIERAVRGLRKLLA